LTLCSGSILKNTKIRANLRLVCNWCYANIYMSRRHTILRNNLIFLFREIVSRLRSCDGVVDLPDASSRLLRGVSEGRKVGSLLTAVSGSPAEGGKVAGGEASGLARGVEGSHLRVFYRWPMDMPIWPRDTSLTVSALDTLSRFRLDLRGHFAKGGESLLAVP